MGIKHDVLVADTVYEVEGVRPAAAATEKRIEVVNRDGAAEIYFRLDGVDPEVEGDNNYVVPAAIGAYAVVGVAGTVTVKLISSGTPKFSVIGRV